MHRREGRARSQKRFSGRPSQPRPQHTSIRAGTDVAFLIFHKLTFRSSTVGRPHFPRAIVVEVGGISEQTFAYVGARFRIRRATPPIVCLIGNRDVDVTSGDWSAACTWTRTTWSPVHRCAPGRAAREISCRLAVSDAGRAATADLVGRHRLPADHSGTSTPRHAR